MSLLTIAQREWYRKHLHTVDEGVHDEPRLSSHAV